MGIVLLFEIWSENISKSNQQFINSDVNILILHDHTILYRCLYKNDECAGNSNYAHLCACFFFFMTQCGLLGPMQKYVNMLHRLDKCFLFIWYLVCFSPILPIRKNDLFCLMLIVNLLDSVKWNEAERSWKLFISNKRQVFEEDWELWPFSEYNKKDFVK